MLLSVTKAMAQHFMDSTKGLAGSIVLTLPWPPSCNHAWKKGKGGIIYLDPKVETFRARVWNVVYTMRRRKSICSEPFTGSVAVMMEFNKPDKRRHDLDNNVKQLWDALTYAGVWVDDAFVVLALSYFGPSCKGGSCKVCVQPLEA